MNSTDIVWCILKQNTVLFYTVTSERLSGLVSSKHWEITHVTRKW